MALKGEWSEVTRDSHGMGGSHGVGAPRQRLHHRQWRAGIDRQAGADRRARRVVDLVDQAEREFDELAFFIGGMGGRLHIKIGQDAQERRPNVHAVTLGEIEQAAEGWENR